VVRVWRPQRAGRQRCGRGRQRRQRCGRGGL